MRVLALNSAYSAKPLFRGANKNNVDVERNIFRKSKKLTGQPIKRPLFR